MHIGGLSPIKRFVYDDASMSQVKLFFSFPSNAFVVFALQQETRRKFSRCTKVSRSISLKRYTAMTTNALAALKFNWHAQHNPCAPPCAARTWALPRFLPSVECGRAASHSGGMIARLERLVLQRPDEWQIRCPRCGRKMRLRV
jgi:hypothetical protein